MTKQYFKMDFCPILNVFMKTGAKNVKILFNLDVIFNQLWEMCIKTNFAK